jgi:hypothetical protein
MEECMSRALLVAGLVALCCGSDVIKKPIEPLSVPKQTKQAYVIYNDKDIVVGLYSNGTNTPTLKRGYRYELVERPDYSH